MNTPKQTGPDAQRAGWRAFFTGAGLPVFLLAAVGIYEAFLLAIVFAPAGEGAWGAFAREFRTWCFSYDPRTGGMAWATVWTMLLEPLFIVGIALLVWREGLRKLLRLGGWMNHWRAVLTGTIVGVLAMAGLYAIGRPAPGADAPELFPGERIRTHLVPAKFELIDQKGGTFRLEEMKGRVVLMTAVYAHCADMCPKLLTELKRLVDSLPAEDRAQLTVAALSLNPEHDTPELRDSVVTAYGFTHPGFRYLNGKPDEVQDLLTRLQFSRVKNADTGVIDHAGLFLVIDARGEIAYRLTLDPRHKTWLRSAVLALTAEARRTNPSVAMESR